MDIEAKKVMITNTNLNGMLKPNNNPNEYTISVGQYTEPGILVKEGNINHHQAMIFDIVYDRIYRMLNEIPNSDDFFGGNLKYSKAYEEENLKLLNKKKLDFLNKVVQLLSIVRDGESLPYNSILKNDLLYAPKDIIDDAFPLIFGLTYRNDLEFKAQERGNFNVIIDLLRKYDIKKYFFEYLLNVIFYGKSPNWDNNRLTINLNSIFDNKERSVYLIKQWFLESEELMFSMTYPITCFFGKKPDYKSKGTYMFPIQSAKPFNDIKYAKSKMEISFSLRNHFMSLFAHDAKIGVHKFIPTKLYKMNSNEFFLGKNLLNNVYYNSRKKVYQSKLNYRMEEMFMMLNLPWRDLNNCNNTYRRKAIHKAIGRLHDNHIINISKLTSERLILNGVWNINGNKCIQQI